MNGERKKIPKFNALQTTTTALENKLILEFTKVDPFEVVQPTNLYISAQLLLDKPQVLNGTQIFI